MKEKAENKQIWNEAARVGILFGAFSSVCLLLKEASALTGSTFVVKAAAIVLWAVEFFGCIWLMKRQMTLFLDKYDQVTPERLYRFGCRVALLSGLILAAADAFLIMQMPQETVQNVLNELSAEMGAKLGATATAEMERMADHLPLLTFIGQWIYCYLYGSLLSSIMSRYVFARQIFNNGPDDPDSPVDDQ